MAAEEGVDSIGSIGSGFLVLIRDVLSFPQAVEVSLDVLDRKERTAAGIEGSERISMADEQTPPPPLPPKSNH